MLLAYRLLNERKRAKLSRQSVASVIGVDRESIRNWEQGRSNPSAVCIAKIARVYRKPMDFFFDVKLNDTNNIKERS